MRSLGLGLLAALAVAVAACGEDLGPYTPYVNTYCANSPDPPSREAFEGRQEALRSRAAPTERKEAVARTITALERLDEAYGRRAPARELRELENAAQDAADEARLPYCGPLGPRRHEPPERPEREPGG
jgi:hypothetical protein